MEGVLAFDVLLEVLGFSPAPFFFGAVMDSNALLELDQPRSRGYRDLMRTRRSEFTSNNPLRP